MRFRKQLTAAVVVGGKEVMKLESEHNEKERLQGKESSVQCYEGEKRQAKAEGPIKRGAHTPPHTL